MENELNPQSPITRITKPMVVYGAMRYATLCHERSNHLYDGKPYCHHLRMVARNAIKYVDLIPNADFNNVLGACWTHDVIEDCRQTYNDVLGATNETIAEITYALTNEKGKNRSQRANQAYYQGIINTPYAAFVKLCDRLANVQYSVETSSPMTEVYRREQRNFDSSLTTFGYEPMWRELENLLDTDSAINALIPNK